MAGDRKDSSERGTSNTRDTQRDDSLPPDSVKKGDDPFAPRDDSFPRRGEEIGNMELREILAELSPEARHKVLGQLAQLSREGDMNQWFVRAVARAINFRETTVRRGEPDRLARWIGQALPRVPEPILAQAFIVLHMQRRPELLSDVYDALGVPHDGPELKDSAGELSLDTTRTVEAARTLVSRWPLGDVRLCFASMIYWCPPAWDEAVAATGSALAALDRDRCADTEPKASPAGGPGEPAAQEESAPETSPTAFEAPEFTALDRTLIRTVVSAFNAIEGSLSVDELDDLVQEVVELNDSRAQSHFHRGFLDALLRRELRALTPGDNRDRRSWYVAAYLLGKMRTEPDVRQVLGIVPAADREILLRPHNAAGTMLSLQVVLPLLKAGELMEAEKWISTQGVTPSLVSQVLAWSSDALLGSDEPTAVRTILERVAEEITHLLPSEDVRLANMAGRVESRLASALRREGRHTEALAILDRLVDSCEDRGERARLLAQTALVKMGIRSLERFELPENGDPRRAFIEAIVAAKDVLLEAERGDEGSPIACMALALPAFRDKPVASAACEEAARRLRRAIDLMIRSQEPVWERTGLLRRAGFYLAVLDLRSLEPGVASSAVDRLHAFLERGVEAPADIVLDAVTNASLHDAPRAMEVAHMALGRYGHRALRALDVQRLAARSEGFRKAVVSILESSSDALKARERWDAWRDILRGSIDSDRRDLETAARALDALEELADSAGLAVRFLDLLENTDDWDPVWSEMEREEARFRIYRRENRLPECRAILVNLLHQAISASRFDDADDLMALLADLGQDGETLDSLRARLERERGAADVGDRKPSPVRADKAVRVLFIGGNETQDGYIPRLRQAIGRRHPRAHLDFETPGWGPNWGRLLPDLESRIEEANVVVLMQFVRTGLGRAVRRLCGKHERRWVACTGHGSRSVERAIGRAIELASG